MPKGIEVIPQVIALTHIHLIPADKWQGPEKWITCPTMECQSRLAALRNALPATVRIEYGTVIMPLQQYLDGEVVRPHKLRVA
mgnify:CR=1 FL=1